MAGPSTDIAPSTAKILSCIPKDVVRAFVARTLPNATIAYDTFEQGYFYESLYDAVAKLPKNESIEFFDTIRKINAVARHKENGRFIQDEIHAAHREFDMAHDLGISRESHALVAWVFCNMPDLWALLDKRSAALEMASYRVSSFWYGDRQHLYGPAEGRRLFKREVKDLLKKSQPIQHVNIESDEGQDVTRYVVHIDPYPGKVPMFDQEKEDDDSLKMQIDLEAEPFQIVDYHEEHKLTIKCKFRRDQVEKIIEYFLRYIIQAEKVPRPRAEFQISAFNSSSFTWKIDQDPDIIDTRTCGIRFMVTHADGVIEEIGHIRTQGDILEYVDSKYSPDEIKREQREILEIQADVRYFSGKRPTYFQQSTDGDIIDNRKVKTARVVLRSTSRVIKNCRGADKKKLEMFLDHNGFFDINEATK